MIASASWAESSWRELSRTMNDRGGRQPWSHLISLPPLLHMRSFHTTGFLWALSSRTQGGEGCLGAGRRKERFFQSFPGETMPHSPLISA